MFYNTLAFRLCAEDGEYDVAYTFCLQEKRVQENEARWPRSLENLKKNHEAQFPKLDVVGQKSILRHYCIQNVKDGIQIRVNKMNKESATHFS